MDNQNINRFVGFLDSLNQRKDRGALARLKRAAGNPYENFEMLPVIGEYIPENSNDWQFKCYMLTASLFALNPINSADKGNLGESLYNFSKKLDVGSDSFENRFAAILNANTEDLAHRLVQVIRQISRENIAVNYSRLLSDLFYWDIADKPVQFRWARSFYAPYKKNDEEKSKDS